MIPFMVIQSTVKPEEQAVPFNSHSRISIPDL